MRSETFRALAPVFHVTGRFTGEILQVAHTVIYQTAAEHSPSGASLACPFPGSFAGPASFA